MTRRVTILTAFIISVILTGLVGCRRQQAEKPADDSQGAAAPAGPAKPAAGDVGESDDNGATAEPTGERELADVWTSFRGIAWGDDISELEGMTLIFSHKDMQAYVRKGEQPTMGGVRLHGVVYNTTAGSLTGVTVLAAGRDSFAGLKGAVFAPDEQVGGSGEWHVYEVRDGTSVEIGLMEEENAVVLDINHGAKVTGPVLDVPPPSEAATAADRLFTTHLQACLAGDAAARDAALESVRELYRDHGADPAVAEALAMCLDNTMYYIEQEGSLPRRKALLDELRDVYEAHPTSPVVRERLAMGLGKVLVSRDVAGDRALRDTLLDELRELHQLHPDEQAPCGELARGLSHCAVDAARAADLPLRDALLTELRDLYAARADDSAVRGAFALGLLGVIYTADHENPDAILNEMRELYQADVDDRQVREVFTTALDNSLFEARMADDLPRVAALSQELRDMAAAHPTDPSLARVKEELDTQE